MRRGYYTDDIAQPGQAYGYFLRSPYAHAKVSAIKTDQARQADGVLGVFTGRDIADGKVDNLICGWNVTGKNGEGMKMGTHPILAQSKMRYLGDHVALVVAETIHQAKIAADLIDVSYDVLPAVVATADVRKKGQALVHDEIANNFTFPAALDIYEVEIDTDAGQVVVDRFTVGG